jgi:hypothetical protein
MIQAMALINDLLNVGTMGESNRLDYAIREHEALQAKYAALKASVDTLIAVLRQKGVLTDDEESALLLDVTASPTLPPSQE